MRLVVGISGATGAVLSIRLLQALRELEVETHLVVSNWGRAMIEMETEHSIHYVRSLADFVYGSKDQTAPIASGSYRTDGMIVAPCSMKTLAGIRTGYGDDLITRAADVTIKERKRLVLVPRETPLSEIHLDNMLALSRMGVVIAPPMPAFYLKPTSLDDIINHGVMRILDQFGLEVPGGQRWEGSVPSLPVPSSQVSSLPSQPVDTSSEQD